mmetsp:Transcript_6180/g.19629  ORF Transcript_6180/g.19629 Transcript_6180/m.19629 type:complete len:381 (+) Transcript_6180:1596-2738(+)
MHQLRAADDERVVEADAQHEEHGDGRRRREDGAAVERQPEGREHRDEHDDGRGHPQPAPALEGVLPIVEGPVGVAEDDDGRQVHEGAVVVEGAVDVLRRARGVQRHGPVEGLVGRAPQLLVELALEALGVGVDVRLLVGVVVQVEVELERPRVGHRAGCVVAQLRRDSEERRGPAHGRAAVRRGAVHRGQHVRIVLERGPAVVPEREDRRLLAEAVPTADRAATGVVARRAVLGRDGQHVLVDVEGVAERGFREEIRVAAVVQEHGGNDVGGAEAVVDPRPVLLGFHVRGHVQFVGPRLVLDLGEAAREHRAQEEAEAHGAPGLARREGRHNGAGPGDDVLRLVRGAREAAAARGHGGCRFCCASGWSGARGARSDERRW